MICFSSQNQTSDFTVQFEAWLMFSFPIQKEPRVSSLSRETRMAVPLFFFQLISFDWTKRVLESLKLQNSYQGFHGFRRRSKLKKPPSNQSLEAQYGPPSHSHFSNDIKFRKIIKPIPKYSLRSPLEGEDNTYSSTLFFFIRVHA